MFIDVYKRSVATKDLSILRGEYFTDANMKRLALADKDEYRAELLQMICAIRTLERRIRHLGGDSPFHKELLVELKEFLDNLQMIRYLL